MKHTPFISIIIMIVGFVGAIGISAKKLMPMRPDMYPKESQDQLERVYMPVLGIDKFYADIQWINLIQDMGQAMLKEGNQKEENPEAKKDKAKYFYRQLDRLTNLSPNTDIFYTNGAMYISHDLPEKAIELLEKGDKYSTVRNWQRANYCAFIQDKVIGARTQDDAAKALMIPKIIQYLETALENNDAPAYVEREWLRKQAILKNIENDELGQLQLWYDHYLSKVVDTTSGMAGEMAGENGTPSQPYINEMDQASQTLRDDIMKKAQKIALDIWNSRTGANAETNKTLDGKLAQVKEIFKAIAPQGHYSPVSLMPYNAGDKFDTATGTPIKVFGICKTCQAKGITTILHGSYCHVCGEKATADEENSSW